MPMAYTSLSAIQAEESGVCLGKNSYMDSECFVWGFAAVFKGGRGKMRGFVVVS
jgi:hypothetical protein